MVAVGILRYLWQLLIESMLHIEKTFKGMNTNTIKRVIQLALVIEKTDPTRNKKDQSLFFITTILLSHLHQFILYQSDEFVLKTS